MSENNRFRMLAYSGAVIQSAWWGRVVFDISGIRLDDKLPALREHARDRVVGTIDGHTKEQAALNAQGYFMGTTDGLEVASLIKEGFPYQASVGIFLETVEELEAGASAQVNGGEFQGPGLIVRQSYCREISFVSLGADAGTSVAALAASAGGGLVAGNGPGDFMEAVKLQMAAGLPVRSAISEAARRHRELYFAYLTKIGQSNKEYLDMRFPNSGFELKIENFMDEGLSRAEALKKAVQDFPELHRDYLTQFTQGETPPQPAPGGGTFEAKVQELVAAGATRGQAIKKAAQDFPALHQDYLDRQNPA
jgi:uncharacterized protein YoaH (UPF0181 family)